MLSLLGFTDLVRQFAAATRASCATAVDFTVGSVFRGLSEASAAIALWLQWLILDVLRQTRLGTSQGTEVDSFVADFGLTRLAGVAAVGQVTFFRYTTGVPVYLSLGTTVQTTDGTQSFTVTADPTNSAYDGSAGYNVLAAVASITVPVLAVTPGSAGNIQAGAISVLTSAIALDTVTNAAPFLSGQDPETDAALRVRFVAYINSRARATETAIDFAISSVQQGLSYQVQENIAPDGTARPGFFTVTVDDGSGAPSAGLLATVSLAIEAYRALTVQYAVLGPLTASVTVSLTITAAAGYQKPTLQGVVAQAILAYIDALPIGGSLPYFGLANIAASVPGVAEIDSLLVNGGAANISGASRTIIRTTLANVAVN